MEAGWRLHQETCCHLGHLQRAARGGHHVVYHNLQRFNFGTNLLSNPFSTNYTQRVENCIIYLISFSIVKTPLCHKGTYNLEFCVKVLQKPQGDLVWVTGLKGHSNDLVLHFNIKLGTDKSHIKKIMVRIDAAKAFSVVWSSAKNTESYSSHNAN